MKALLVLVISLLVAAGSWAQIEPTSARLPLWAAEVQKEKPYVLELAYADASSALPRRDPSDGADVALTVTDDFLDEASRIRIGVSSTDTGTVEPGDGCKIIYKLQQEGSGFTVQIFLQTAGDGTRMINTRLVLSEAQWVVFSGASSKSMGEDRMHFYVAIRIETRG
jgi:hypothetical protein